jgi:hypothetical protein
MKYALRSPTLLGKLSAVDALRFCGPQIGRGGETRTHTFHGLNVVSLPIRVRPFVLDAELRRLQIVPRGDLARDPRADPAGLKPATSRFVARCSVRLSYRSWGVGRRSNPRPRETNRTRTGTHPGHNRALYPVKLQSPCSACGLAEDLRQDRALSQRISSGGSCRAHGGPGEDRTPACRISPGRSTNTELQVQTRGHENLRVEKAGIEPATSCLRRRRSPNVSYIPRVVRPCVFEARARCASSRRWPPPLLTFASSSVSREGIEPSTARIKSPRLCH